MRRSFLFVTSVLIAGCDGPTAAPDSAARAYVLAANDANRLRLVIDPETVRPLLGRRHLSVASGCDDCWTGPPQRLAGPGEWYAVWTAHRRGEVGGETQFYVGKVGGEFRIDWPATAGHNPSPLKDILSRPDAAPGRYRVIARLTSYYYHEFWATEARYQSIDLADPDGSSSVYGFVDRQSEAGTSLLRLLKDGGPHAVTVEVSRTGPGGQPIENSESNVGTITAVVSETWHY